MPDGNYLYYKTYIGGKWRVGVRNPNQDDRLIVNGSIGECTKDGQVSTPADCDGEWAIPSDTIDSNIFVEIAIGGECPSWTALCAQISINTNDYSSCSGIFTKTTEFGYPNVYEKDSGGIYFYFNHKAWEWRCSDNVDFNNCKSTGSDNIFRTDSSEYWQDLNVNGGITTIVSTNDKSIGIICETTTNPTPSPTSNPLIDSDIAISNLNINVFCAIIVFIYALM